MFRVKVVKNPQRVSEYHGNSPANATQLEEERMQWIGTGAAVLRLAGPCDNVAIERIASGRNPHTGLYLPGITVRSVRRSCYDLLFAAPKSASVLALVGGDRSAVDAHVDAANTAFYEIEQWITTAAKRTLYPKERSQNLVGAHAIHTHSRRGDPHLHSHILAFNSTYSLQQGRWVALDLEALLYNRAQYFRTIYQNQLAYKLASSGYEISRTTRAVLNVEGVSSEMCEIFSKGEREATESGQAHYGSDEARATSWGNERSRERQKAFVEGYTHDRERWRDELGALTVQLDETVARAAEQRERQREQQCSGEEAVRLTRSELAKEMLVVTPYRLAIATMERFFGQHPWERLRDAVRRVINDSQVRSKMRRTANRRVRAVNTLPLEVRPWDAIKPVQPRRYKLSLGNEQNHDWRESGNDAIIAEYEPAATRRHRRNRLESGVATEISEPAAAGEAISPPDLGTRHKAKL